MRISQRTATGTVDVVIDPQQPMWAITYPWTLLSLLVGVLSDSEDIREIGWSQAAPAPTFLPFDDTKSACKDLTWSM
jgi:hypothetical protein